MRKIVLTTLVAGLLLCSTVGATIISITGWEIRVDDTFNGSVTVFEDATFGDDMVLIEIVKNFESPNFNVFGIGQALMLEFTRTSDTGPSTIAILNEHIRNDTGVDWYDFHMAVSWDINSSTAVGVGFDPDHKFTAGTADNPFNSVEFAQYTGLPIDNDPSPQRLDFTDGIVAAGTKWIPGNDGLDYVSIVTDLGEGDKFWLKEWPTIPEPATIGLLLSGAIWLRQPKRRRA